MHGTPRTTSTAAPSCSPALGVPTRYQSVPVPTTTTTTTTTAALEHDGRRPPVRLRVAATEQDHASFEALCRAYVKWLDEDLAFQSFEEEMTGLPGAYAQPQGCILLASVAAPPGDDGGQPGPDAADADASPTMTDVGCIAVRPLPGTRLGDRACELKRLYVLPRHEGRGIGRLLVREALSAARAKGYETAALDTLQRLAGANGLYRRFGFTETAPYYDNPLPSVVFWQKRLAD